MADGTNPTARPARLRRSLLALVVMIAALVPAVPASGSDGELQGGGAIPPGGRFFDDDGSTHEDNIEAIATAGVTLGCNAQGTAYCPGDSVNRAQMASFLARASDLPDSLTDWFTDDDGSSHEANINKVADAEITLGCGGTDYCPGELVTRAQMASFLSRALDLPDSLTDWFGDDDGSSHEANINKVADAGITLGCGDGSYCPLDPVTRAQMASFIARAFAYPAPNVPARTITYEGSWLSVISRADAAGCPTVNEPGTFQCAYEIDSFDAFFLETGFAYTPWSLFPATKQDAVQTDLVALDVTFDGVVLDLTEWPFEVLLDTGLRYWAYQFPHWLDGEHELIVVFTDATESEPFLYTMTITIHANGGGYSG